MDNYSDVLLNLSVPNRVTCQTCLCVILLRNIEILVQMQSIHTIMVWRNAEGGTNDRLAERQIRLCS